MMLSHFTDAHISSVRSLPQVNEPHFKPQGFWLSVDGVDDWRQWCERESFGIGRIRYRVKVSSSAQILTLSSPKEIDDFTEQFQVDIHGLFVSIDWKLVSSQYQGIIIAPYQWSRRHLPRTFWYYPWDCASGCVWDASAIEQIEVAL